MNNESMLTHILKEINEIQKNGYNDGLKIGYEEFDKNFDGFKEGATYIFNGNIYSPVFNFILNIVINMYNKNQKVLIYSQRFDEKEIFKKLLSIGSIVDYNKIEHGKIRSDEWLDMFDSCYLLENIKISCSNNIDDVCRQIYAEYFKNKIKIFIFDSAYLAEEEYLQTINEFEKITKKLNIIFFVVNNAGNKKIDFGKNVKGIFEIKKNKNRFCQISEYKNSSSKFFSIKLGYSDERLRFYNIDKSK